MYFESGDKAYNHEEEVVGLRDPHIAIHGSFSFMVCHSFVSGLHNFNVH